MEDIAVPNPRLTFSALMCPENEAVFAPFVKEPKILELSRVSLEWMKRKDMLKQKKTSSKLRQIFVIPNFEDEQLFNHVFSLKHSIWGPSIIAHCFSESNPLPMKYRILYSLAFEGITVSFTGLSPEVKAIQGKRVELMGGKVSPEFSMAVDILIAKDCEATPKYRAAFCWNKPICHLTVIDAIWEGGSKHVSKRVNKDRNDFAMEIFADCVVCVSGIKIEERPTIGKVIEESGGKYATEMERGICTHLITDSLDGDKYKFALKWGGIRIVSTRWLRKSLDRKMRLPEDYYHPDPALRKQDEAIGNIEKDAVFPNTVRKAVVQPKYRVGVPIMSSVPAFVSTVPMELYNPSAFSESKSSFAEKPAKINTLNEENEPMDTEENGESSDVEITFIVPSAEIAYENAKSERTLVSHVQEQESDDDIIFVSQAQGQRSRNVPVKDEPERTFVSQVEEQESQQISIEEDAMIDRIEEYSENIAQMSDFAATQEEFQDTEPKPIKKGQVTMNNSAQDDQAAKPKSIKKERANIIDKADDVSAHEESVQMDDSAQEELTRLSINPEDVTNFELDETLNQSNFSRSAQTTKKTDLSQSMDQAKPIVRFPDEIDVPMEVDQEEPTIDEGHENTLAVSNFLNLSKLDQNQTYEPSFFSKSVSITGYLGDLDATKAVNFTQAGDAQEIPQKQSEITPGLNDTIVLDESIVEVKKEVEERTNRLKPKQLQAQETLPSVSSVAAPMRSNLLPDEVQNCYRPSMFVSMRAVEKKGKGKKEKK